VESWEEVAIAKHQCGITYPNIATVRVHEDSTVDLHVGSTDVGQGTFIGLAQIVADEFRISVQKVRITSSDTLLTPVATGSSGSRQLVQMGLAVAAACREAKSKIFRLAAKVLEVSESSLSIAEGIVCS
jgi:CO/xanthine dehydrogenase Mo-binding subunit